MAGMVLMHHPIRLAEFAPVFNPDSNIRNAIIDVRRNNAREKVVNFTIEISSVCLKNYVRLTAVSPLVILPRQLKT
jgi:hypothetical protein